MSERDEIDCGHAAIFIGEWLRTYARMDVRQYKEKFGTVRVYCNLGWTMFHTIWKPGHCWSRYPYHWMWTLDVYYGKWLLWPIQWLALFAHIKLYRWRYKQAVKRWPHIARNIVVMADYEYLLEGLLNKERGE